MLRAPSMFMSTMMSKEPLFGYRMISISWILAQSRSFPLEGSVSSREHRNGHARSSSGNRHKLKWYCSLSMYRGNRSQALLQAKEQGTAIEAKVIAVNNGGYKLEPLISLDSAPKARSIYTHNPTKHTKTRHSRL